MAAKHLSERENWQRGARIIGDAGENSLCYKLSQYLLQHYVIEHRPSKLSVYGDKKGIILDAKIMNTETGKCLFLEKKTGNNGGNAHERVYKFLSPGLKKVVKNKYNTVEDPFFLVFSGQTFQRKKYRDELSLLLEEENYAIVNEQWSNISQVAEQIMEIV